MGVRVSIERDLEHSEKFRPAATTDAEAEKEPSGTTADDISSEGAEVDSGSGLSDEELDQLFGLSLKRRLKNGTGALYLFPIPLLHLSSSHFLLSRSMLNPCCLR